MSRVLSVFLLVGCAKPASTTIVTPPVEPAPADMPEIKTAEPSPEPVVQTGTHCELEVARDCPGGMVDGCLDGRTNHHVCVASSEVAGSPCGEGTAKECPEGQVDACEHSPKLADTRLCVVP